MMTFYFQGAKEFEYRDWTLLNIQTLFEDHLLAESNLSSAGVCAPCYHLLILTFEIIVC